jgi:hypothetical protein
MVKLGSSLELTGCRIEHRSCTFGKVVAQWHGLDLVDWTLKELLTRLMGGASSQL